MRILITLIALFFSPAAFACGPDSNCQIGTRHYRIAMPQGHDGTSPVGALVWSHGYRGSAAGAMRNRSLRRMVSDAGLALIAAQGVNGSWDLPFGPSTYDSTGASEFSYFEKVLEDASGRYPLDRTKIIASGFSAGGMMVWNLACAHPENFVGFIPMSGTFWLKAPESCAQPVTSIVHIHGTADRTVPLTGRAIRETKQGEVMQALGLYRTFGGFGPAEEATSDNLHCRNRANPQGQILEYCLFDGGHSFSTKHLAYGIERLRSAGRL